MKGDELSRAYVVSDPAAAVVFTNSRLRRLLMLFAGRQLSLGDAARIANVDLKRLHHHAGRLVRLGLLEVAAARPRAGRPIKLYRAAAESFFISQQLLPTSSTEGLADELRKLLTSEEQRSIDGILVGIGKEGEPSVRFVPRGEPVGRSFELWRILRLSPADFGELRSDLDAVLVKYQQRISHRGRVHLVHAAGVVRSDDSGVPDNKAG